jgi:hypothetical protein
MIRSLAVLLMGVSLCPLVASAADEARWPEWVEKSRELSMQLGTELKAELGAAIQKGGPVAAIDVCHTRAPAIAERLSAESGARVGRTALRVRNASNAPDDVQRAQAVIAAIPGVLDRAARDREEAMPLLFGLLFSAEPTVQKKQRFELKARMGERMTGQSADYAERVHGLHAALRLPLAMLALATLLGIGASIFIFQLPIEGL